MAWSWLRLPYFKYADAGVYPKQVFFTIIVAVRNEAENIALLLADFNKQSIGFQAFEVIIINDNSTDDTARIVQNYIPKVNYSLQIFPLLNPSQSPKKQAIQLGITYSQGNWIITTDGDCRVHADWLAVLYQFIQKTSAKLVSGGVTFNDSVILFEQIQTVEFAGLVGSGASTLSMGFPTMCNGANLTYEKEAFLQVKGFDGVTHLASGDDEFLFHKIAQKYPKQVFFLKNAQTVVHTQAQHTWQGFAAQRQRWGSKWKHYKDGKIKILAILIFLVNLGILIGLGAWGAGYYEGRFLLLQLGLKWLPEIFYLNFVLRFLDRAKYIILIPVVQLIYPFYIVFFGLLANKSSYQWKGRSLK
jgi:glycosyltransferase involved in cell wall biosynthesis